MVLPKKRKAKMVLPGIVLPKKGEAKWSCPKNGFLGVLGVFA